MKDNHETKVQFMNESEELRQRITELETKRKQAQEKLKKYRGNLGDLMEERSAELKRIHKQLKREITKRRKAREKIRQQNEFLNTIIESLTHPFYIIDANDYTIKLANSAAYAGDLSKKITCYALTRKRSRPCGGSEYLCPLKEVKKTKKPVTVEHIHYIDDNPRVFEVHCFPVFDSKGNIVQMIEYSLDITERKQAEEELKSSEERLRILFEYAPDAYYLNDLKGNFIDGNRAAEKITDYKRKELVGKNFLKLKLLSPAEMPKAAASLAKSALGKATGPDEFVLNRKDGSQVPVEIRTFPVKIKDKTLVLGIARDITERKNAEAIRNVLFNISNATTETSNLNDLLATIHKQVGTLMDAKNFFVCLAHDTEKNLCTFPYYKDINPEDIVEPDEIHEITEGLTHHVLKTKKYLLGNKQELKKIGVIGTVPESWLGVPLKTEGGDVNGVVAVQSYEKEAYSEKDAQFLSIITSNITGALKYKKAEERLKASLKEKEVLLREIHHRVKNNLQIISSLLKLQSQHIEDKRYVEMFKDSQDRIRSMSLIHEMLYQSKQLSKINFKEYIRTLTNYLLRSCWPSPHKIVLKIKSEEVYLAVDNAIPCGLIINELVSNSLKHAFPDGKEGQIKIALHSINKEDVEIVVSDDGVGIPEDLDFRNTKSLGLHLVTILAEDQLHGEIKLDRKKGTEFQIKLRGVK